MRNLDKELQNRSIDINKLVSYGFIEANNYYEYQDYLLNKKFKMVIIFSENTMTSKVIDTETNDEYSLVDVPHASGEFIIKLRQEYNEKLTAMITMCSTIEIFRSEYAKLVINYVKNKYKDDLEFLWPKFSNNAVVRHKASKKWYLALLTVLESKIGLNSDKVVEIINLKNTSAEIKKLVDNLVFFPGYHMNKTHWFTMKLDGSVPIDRIFAYIDISYGLNQNP